MGVTYTLDEAYSKVGFGPCQCLMFLFVGIAWAGDGMEMMLLSFLGPEIKCAWGITSAQESLITSVVFVGMMFGSYTWGALSDKKGRKAGFFATAVFTAIFGALSAVAPNYACLLVARGLVGFGLGGVHVAYTLFMEFLPATNRGRWLCLIELCWTIGSLTQAALAWVVLPSHLGWRGLVLLSALPLAFLILIYPFLRESPHWLLSQGHPERAEASLLWMARLNGTTLPEGRLLNVLPQAQAAALSPQALAPGSGPGPDLVLEAPKVGWGQAVGDAWQGLKDSAAKMVSPALRRTTLLLQVIWMLVALSYYGLIILAVELHADDKGGCLESGRAAISGSDFRDIFITTMGEVAGLLACMAAVDYIGRRRTLSGSLLLVAIFLVPLLATLTGEIVYLVATRLFVYSAFICLYIYTPEVYPTSIRSYAFGVANAMSRIGGLLAPFIAVDLREQVGSGAAEGVLLGACIVSGGLAMLLPIETMGKELAESVQEVELSSYQHGDFGDQPGDLESGKEGPRGPRGASLGSGDADGDAAGSGAAGRNPFFEEELGATGEGEGKLAVLPKTSSFKIVGS